MHQIVKSAYIPLAVLLLITLSCGRQEGGAPAEQHLKYGPAPSTSNTMHLPYATESTTTKNAMTLRIPTTSHRKNASSYESLPASSTDCSYFNEEIADFYRVIEGSQLPVATAMLDGNIDASLEALHDDPDARPFYLTPLMLSSLLGCTEIMQALIDLGNDPNEVTTHDTPLILAIGSGNLSAVRLLLEHGADPNTAAPRLGNTPLSAAAYYDQLDTIAMLLEAGANIHETANKGGETAIAAAGHTNAATAAAALLEAGIEFTAEDLKVAIWKKSTDFFRVVVESGEIRQISCAERQVLAAAALADGAYEIAEMLRPGC